MNIYPLKRLAILNGLYSKFQDNLTTKQARDARLLAQGFKSKIINYALDTVLEGCEST